MWYIAEYEPVSFFSLKPASSTSSGGKTLLCPTPFAIKMALLDASIRLFGISNVEKYFAFIRDLQIAIKLPSYLVVNKTFAKIMRQPKEKEKGVPYQNTITCREYVYFVSSIKIAFCFEEDNLLKKVFQYLLKHINYLGKRGGFVQFYPHVNCKESLTNDFVHLTKNEMDTFSLVGLLQVMDDCGPKLTFDHVNIYSQKKMTLGKDRILRNIVFPYQLLSSSKNFTTYKLL